MTISSTVRNAGPFSGEGVASLPFNFKVFAVTDLEVILTTLSTGEQTTLSRSTHYTVSLNGNQNTSPGGTVTLVTPLTDDQSVAVLSAVPETQLTSVVNGGGFYPSVLNAALDRLVAAIQQHTYRLDRTLRGPQVDEGGGDLVPMPRWQDRANMLLGFDENGHPKVVDPSDVQGTPGAEGPQGPPGEGGVDPAGDTMTGDLVFSVATDKGITIRRASDSVVLGYLRRNNDAIVLAAQGATIPLQFGAGGSVRATAKPSGSINFAPLSADPDDGEAGDVYYNSVTGTLRFHNGTAWADVGPTGSGTPGLASDDSRVINWVDPDIAFASLVTGHGRYQVYWPNGDLNTLSEPGILGKFPSGGGNDTDYALWRTDHPAASGKKGYRHRIKSTWDEWAPGFGLDPTYRSEITQPGTGATTITRGTTYWLAFSLCFESDILQAAAQEMSVFDLHVEPDVGDGVGPGPMHMYLDGGSLLFQLRYNQANPTIPASSTLAHSHSFNPVALTEYQFVMQVKMDYRTGYGAFCKLWRRAGNAGAISQVCNYTGPLGYNDSEPATFAKLGLYFFGAPYGGWQGVTTRTLWTRGWKILEDATPDTGEPVIDQNVMFNTFA